MVLFNSVTIVIAHSSDDHDKDEETSSKQEMNNTGKEFTDCAAPLQHLRKGV